MASTVGCTMAPFPEVGNTGKGVGFKEKDSEFSFEFIALECSVTFL